MQYTTNLNLKKPEETEFYNVNDFNDNADKIDEQLNLKAPKNSPAFTGTPTTPTPTAGDDSKKIANTQFVNSAINSANEADFNEHNADTNAHTSKIATQSEAETGTNNVKFMTPLRTKQAINKFAPVKSINGVVADNEGDVSLRNALYCHDASEFMEELGTAGWNSKGVYAVTFSNTDNFPQKPSPYCVVFNLAETPNNGYAIQIAVNILNGDIYVRGTNNQKEIDDVPFEKLVRNSELLAMLPVGTILPFAGGTIPSGFLATNGAAVSRTTYSALFSAIGTTYGSGDGSTTFNLPLIEDNRFLEFASTAGTKKNAGLPNITGTFRYDVYATGRTGAFSTGSANDFRAGASQTGTIGQDIQTVFDASDSNSIYGGSTTVQPKSLTVRAIIKY